ncbi:ABC transporter permease [Methylobacterium aerolatum]|uniref:Capsular polysaccharide transport system permease protein n=1 Tax=Methylobacterium aerolatum TaxID=418708 RepID=A0ABU0I1V8_9HYPH|nr:ABC transporter permease [Methylobacterium aerolatum]MDQ0448581.1 capsular polysaccharide transport system permease protein [Methylobacterium aerolatum]GJD33198.1 Polysialic acid transport protein KpsM [Methylobacterium aerolatum]
MAAELTTTARGGNPYSPLESYLHVVHALMLRDMRTRFGGTLWGYAVVVLWPCIHIFALIGIYTFQHIPAPVGTSSALFFATGAVPVLIFQYISREVMKAVLVNRPLTYYPQVKLFDLILARVLVEIVTGFIGLLLIVSVLVALGIDPRPTDSFVAVTGYLAAILLGIGVGVVNVAIVGFFPGWLIGYALFNIVMYVASGIIFMPSFLPEKIYVWMKYNPALQLTEWVRSAYYPSVGLRVDYLYVVMFALTSLSVGLLLVKHVVSKRT